MVGIVLITHGTLGESLMRAAAHTLGKPLEHVEHVSVGAVDIPELVLARVERAMARVDDGGGVLILTDMFGATPANVASRVLQDGRVEGLSGANLPMLVRAIAHRDLPLAVVVEKAQGGGTTGVVYMNRDKCCGER
ncbi:MAG: PTS fructose transporter subunit IIA [Betaproteobacteria bacterium]|nr:PTS fructose transporter subunit IIA [Betaproteobacteria bacterium]